VSWVFTGDVERTLRPLSNHLFTQGGGRKEQEMKTRNHTYSVIVIYEVYGAEFPQLVRVCLN